MSAVRKLQYNDFERIASTKRQSEVPKCVQKKSQPFVFHLFYVIAIITIVLAVGSVATFIISRYVKISQLQLQIFQTKQEMVELELKIDELIVKKESFMTLEEIESYAIQNLSMIKPTEKNKVVIFTGESTMAVKDISFYHLPKFKRSQTGSMQLNDKQKGDDLALE